MRMMRLLFLVALLSVLACNRKPKTDKDQVSYTIGAQFGKSLKTQSLDLDPSALSRGIVDGYSGGGAMKLTEEEMQAAMMKLSEKRQNDQKAESEVNKGKAQEFLLNNKSVEGVMTTASGLQYKISNPGTGAQPKGDDIVVVHYKGTLVDGTEFDSSYKRNQPAEFPLNGVIPGWTEGLQLLKKGGKAQFWIPPELGYGERARNQIPSNAVLIFDVELLEVKPAAQKKKK